MTDKSVHTSDAIPDQKVLTLRQSTELLSDMSEVEVVLLSAIIVP